MKSKKFHLSDYLETLQKEGRYTFCREEALITNGLSPLSFKRSIQRLLLKKKIIRPVRKFYVIVPTEYQQVGAPPPFWFIDDLMQFFKRPYYIGLLTAALLHGAAHQQPQQFQVITNTSIRPIRAGNSQIAFFKKKNIHQAVTEMVKTQTGYIRISTPEMTALDLVFYFKSSGYLSHVATILNELWEKMDGLRLLAIAKEATDISYIQRLGYLLEQVSENTSLTEPLYRWIHQKKIRFVNLLPKKAFHSCDKNLRWKLYINENIEIDE